MTRSPRLRRLAITTAGLALGLGVLPATTPADAAPASVATKDARRSPTLRNGVVVTPGNFTGYGFDQCQAPSQETMNVWWRMSPYSAAGIYIAGASRGCRNQTYLDKEWVAKQAKAGWRLLPITLGPQASCQPMFPRYGDDPTISPKPGKDGSYSRALKMGRRQASSSVEAAGALGIAEQSTLWYDLEGFDVSNTRCRESALSFLSGWTQRVRSLGYVSGVYSSAGSGLKALDDARVNRPARFTLPDRIWIARWDGQANTSTDYIRDDGWRPGGRMKQYRGGHDEKWGSKTINIDSNFLDLGKGTTARAEQGFCDGITVSLPDYGPLRPAYTNKSGDTVKPDPGQVKALQCLLKRKGYFDGTFTGRYGGEVLKATQQWQGDHGFAQRRKWSRANWMSLLAAGPKNVVKYGSSGEQVRRLQRALNAAAPGTKLWNTGVYGPGVDPAVKAWQKRVGIPADGVVNAGVWRKLQAGARG
ncbi:glycoside hydrolase domain-containing protein [Nocardioides acrostichi]|uniref:DUF1906 domain-containing protein n=1 Tax=Nocardioides acrostichi TaxID=2784339 RepID=A0A930UXG2_9ACTN|nr:glycoside hydrolase domain-containing protein [Nocardioides acrostichi]MBF4162658.1 DUF1906 domain-containing protein [Nocardioides acrostichi]